jgi:hypothetical protein
MNIDPPNIPAHLRPVFISWSHADSQRERYLAAVALNLYKNVPVEPTLLGGAATAPHRQQEFIAAIANELGKTEPPVSEPPAAAEFLLNVFARTKHQQAALGDLNETFIRNCEQYGRRRACRLYWAEALRSLGPLLVRTLGRLAKWGAIVDAIKTHLLS